MAKSKNKTTSPAATAVTPEPDPRRAKFPFTVAGLEVYGQVSPCVWMYHKYPLQVEITNGGSDHIGRIFNVDKTKTWENATVEDIRALCFLHLQPCKNKGCKRMAVDHKKHETNRNGECETCFMDKLRKELSKAQEKELAADKRKDAQMYKKGCRFKVSAWVHPHTGDDYMLHLYSAHRLDAQEIRSRLAEEGSTKLDDYTQSELTAPAKNKHHNAPSSQSPL
jgi:hypothetical protein